MEKHIKNITILENMINSYNECENLNGSLITEIENQIKHCKECIDNLNKYDTGKGGYYITVKSDSEHFDTGLCTVRDSSPVYEAVEVLVKSNASMKSTSGWFTTDTKSNIGEDVVIENNNGTKILAKRLK